MGKKTALETEISREIYMGQIPVLTNERIYDFMGVTLTSSGMGIASWCYVQGAWLASVLPLYLTLFVSIVPMLLMGLILLIITTIPTKYGVDNSLMQKAVFGTKLAKIIFLVMILSAVGWFSINAQIFATSLTNICAALGTEVSANLIPIIILVYLAIAFLITTRGPQFVKYSMYIMVPGIVFVGIAMLIKAATSTTWEELNSVELLSAGFFSSQKIAFLAMCEGMFVFATAWYASLGQFSRLTNSRRSAYWGQIIGFILIMEFFIIIGAITGALMAQMGVYSDNPTDWMIAVAGPIWGILSLVAIALANVSTQISGLYAWIIATKSYWNKLNITGIAVVWTLYCFLLSVWNGVWTYYSTFIAVIGATASVATAILLADYFVVRKGKFSLGAIYELPGRTAYKYTNGHNLFAMIIFILGSALYLYIYDPINFASRNDILMLLTPSGVSMIVSFAAYAVLSKVPFINKYLLADRKEIEEYQKRIVA